MLTEGQRKLALDWYIKGFDLITIAQHFGISRDDLARELRRKQ
jgi:predicted DNA-binding protein YlxM (UPF0122 family)